MGSSCPRTSQAGVRRRVIDSLRERDRLLAVRRQDHDKVDALSKPPYFQARRSRLNWQRTKLGVSASLGTRHPCVRVPSGRVDVGVRDRSSRLGLERPLQRNRVRNPADRHDERGRPEIHCVLA